MKSNITRLVSWILIIVCIALLIPSLGTRLQNEEQNKNITVSVLYNDLVNNISDSEFEKHLEQYKKAGITNVVFMEEDINSLVAEGDLTCIKYNVLRHKYDDESMVLVDLIKEKCPDITVDAYIVITKRDETKQKLKYHLPRRYSEKEYAFVGSIENQYENSGVYTSADVYVFFDGHKQLWDLTVGYNQEDLQRVKDMGFDISLMHTVKNYPKTDYLEDFDNIIKKFDVEYFNLKEDSYQPEPGKEVTENYQGLARIINSNNMTLVVAENSNQLSNQRFLGYDYVLQNVVRNKSNNAKVLRSFETYDETQADDTKYLYKANQYFNSCIDRNIRFIVVTQITISTISYPERADLSFKATSAFVEKIKAEGFSVNGQTTAFNYSVNKSMNYALCAVIMVMAVMIMIRIAFSKSFVRLSFISVIVAILGFTATIYAPVRFASLIALYPTLYAAAMSCFAMTLLLYFIKNYKDKFPTIMLSMFSLVIMLLSLLLFSTGLGSMLSGIDFYINNDIFRGIKLTLLIPVVYTAILYYIMFIKSERTNLLTDLKKVLTAEIKVYWLIIAGVIGFIGIYYILRSGNVNTISSGEAAMRNTLTEIFAARPRTKEFLIGYPALLLLCYYMKNRDIKLISWLLATASSILAASVTNSFCHVFTDYMTIVERTFNGLIVGLVVCVFAIIGNSILIKAAKKISSKLQNEEK